MAVSFGSFNETGWQTDGQGTDTFTVSAPSSISAGDLLVAIGFSYDTGGDWSNIPSGFSNIASSGGDIAVWWKTATSSDESTSSYSFDKSNNSGEDSHAKLSMYRFTGAARDYAPDIVRDTASTSGSTHTISSSLTPEYSDSLFFFLFFSAMSFTGQDVSNYAINTDNPSWAEQNDDGSGDAGYFDGTGDIVRAATATASRPETTSSGDISADCSNTDGSPVISLLAIYPPTDASGSSSLLEASPSLFSTNGSVGANGNASLLEGAPNIFTQSGSADKKLWTNESTNNTTWTNET